MARKATGFPNVDKQSSLLGVGATAEWDLGELVFQPLAARRRVEAGKAGVGVSADEARITAVNAYFDLVPAHANLAITRERLKEADETVRIAELLRNTGAGLLSEVKRAQAARAEVKQRVAAAEEKVRVTSLNLTESLHIAPLIVLVPVQEPQDRLALVPPERGLMDLASDALDHRPELAESRALWAALDQERKAAILGPLIPTVKGGAFGGSLGPGTSRAQGTQDYSLGLERKVGPGGIGDVSRARIANARQNQENIRFAQLAALLALRRMKRDVFPDMGIPIIYVAQPYGGMDPAQMEGFLVNYYEYHFLYITGIEHVESKSIQGAARIKLQFHPGTNMAQAMAETISYINRAKSFMPPGTVPPFAMRFDAGSVPVGDPVFSSDKRTLTELQERLRRLLPQLLPNVHFSFEPNDIISRVMSFGSPTPVEVAVSEPDLAAKLGRATILNTLPVVPVGPSCREPRT